MTDNLIDARKLFRGLKPVAVVEGVSATEVARVIEKACPKVSATVWTSTAPFDGPDAA